MPIFISYSVLIRDSHISPVDMVYMYDIKIAIIIISIYHPAFQITIFQYINIFSYMKQFLDLKTDERERKLLFWREL